MSQCSAASAEWAVWGGVVLAGRDGAPRSQQAAGDASVSHVDGLGLYPRDDSLVVATHYGSFRIEPDAEGAERIGCSFQDTMGFTVVGPDHFAGQATRTSRACARANRDASASSSQTTAGATWTSRSLSGDVDFHGLAFAHDQVYGWDAGTGRFMVSGDREQWETRSTVELAAFAVDPEDRDHIVGGRLGGLVESMDGGRTWPRGEGPQTPHHQLARRRRTVGG